MKKKELKAEIERLNKLVSEQRQDIRTLLSDEKEFNKKMIKYKYEIADDLERTMWQGCKGSIGEFNGLILTAHH